MTPNIAPNVVPAAVAAPIETRVRRRRVLYIPGFIAAGPELHHGIFRREAEKFARQWDVELTTGRLEPSEFPHGGSWTASLTGPDAAVDTRFEVLRWDDIAARDLDSPLLAKLPRGLAALADGVLSGMLFKVWRAAPWFAFVWIYPFLWLAICAGFGALAGSIAGAVIGAPGGVATGLGSAFAALWLLSRSNLFAVHLLDDWVAQRRYRRGEDAALEARLDAFATRLIEAANARGVDEVLVVGHSSGSFLAIDVMARALRRDPAFARRGPAVSLLTLGTAELLIALHPGGQAMRDAIARLADEPDVFWAEVATRFDVLNFPKRSPVEELGLAPGANPTFRRIKMAHMVDKARFPARRRLWDVMRLHFQFVMANDVRGPYEFFSLVCGTRLAREQFSRPKDEPMGPIDASPRFARSKTLV